MTPNPRSPFGKSDHSETAELEVGCPTQEGGLKKRSLTASVKASSPIEATKVHAHVTVKSYFNACVHLTC